MAKKSGLGRGLESLLGETAGEVTNGRDDVLEVSLGDIVANENQPRRNFDEGALAELAESIEKNGVLQPILVRRVGAKYEKWLRTSGITAGIPVAAPLHHMDERLMHPEDRGTRWRRVMQAD